MWRTWILRNFSRHSLSRDLSVSNEFAGVLGQFATSEDFWEDTSVENGLISASVKEGKEN